MNNDTIDLKSEKLFPWQFQFIGIIFLIVGIGLMIVSPYLAPILIVIGAFILTAYRGVEFNCSTKTYRNYNSFLFIKTGKFKPYDSVEKIYINESKVSQMIYTKITTGSTFRHIEYNAYLKFAHGIKIFLASKKDKKKLIDKLTGLAEFFQVEISDNTVQ
jgi:hypothetical protein